MFSFFNKENKIKEQILELPDNSAISYITPDYFSTKNVIHYIDVWRDKNQYKLVLRQIQIVGKKLMNGWKGQTYTIKSDAIYSEKPIGVYSNIEELAGVVHKYRTESKDYFSKSNYEWSNFKNGCLYLPEKNILIPPLASYKCPKCGKIGLIASTPLTFDSQYFICFCCNYYITNSRGLKKVDMVTGKGQARFCDECRKLSKFSMFRLKNGKNGYFWGCDSYPSCKNTRNLWQ